MISSLVVAGVIAVIGGFVGSRVERALHEAEYGSRRRALGPPGGAPTPATTATLDDVDGDPEWCPPTPKETMVDTRQRGQLRDASYSFDTIDAQTAEITRLRARMTTLEHEVDKLQAAQPRFELSDEKVRVVIGDDNAVSVERPFLKELTRSKR